MSKKIAEKSFEAEMVLEGSWGERKLGKHASTMDLWETDSRWRFFIEWDIPSLERTEEIGIWVEPGTKVLSDYDGVFSLPIQAVALLEENGFTVGEDFR